MTDDTPAPPPPAEVSPGTPPAEPMQTQPADGPMFPMPTMENITAGRGPVGERRGQRPSPPTEGK